MIKIDREIFAEKLKEERTLREHVRKAIAIVKKRKKNHKNAEILEEKKLRNIIKALILEGTPPSSDKPGPIHQNKGMNELEALLGSSQILDTLKGSYQSLTTTRESRNSFRAHLINAIENLLDNIDLLRRVDEEIKIDVGEDLDGLEGIVDPTKSDADKKQDEYSIPGMDLTGRDESMEAFDNIETQIKKSYTKLHDPKDQKLFRDYLITNLKLWFDTWEEELSETVEEPTTDEYEQEKAQTGEEL